MCTEIDWLQRFEKLEVIYRAMSAGFEDALQRWDDAPYWCFFVNFTTPRLVVISGVFLRTENEICMS